MSGAAPRTALWEQMRACTKCPELVASRTQVVVGDAPAAARLLLLGEAPGAQEDESGRPFVGRSGQLLDRLLGEVGLARRDIAVLNTVMCRPPGNRPPTRAESTSCRQWTELQLDLVAPDLVVTLGLSATRWFLGSVTLSAVRGQVHDLRWPVLPTYHPSAVLRSGPNGQPAQLLAQDLALAAARIAP